MLLPQLVSTFDTIIEAFLFLDKNGDGKLNRKDVVKALNQTSPWEKSPAHVTRTRFSMELFTCFIVFLASFLTSVLFCFLNPD